MEGTKLLEEDRSSFSNTESISVESKDAEQELFARARSYLNLGRCYRIFTFLFAERKLVVFFWVHFMCTMIIWTHFALTKFQEQEDTVPEGAPRYWWKRLVPPLEFGSMHAILFQMALIPLTMSRYSISALSGSFVNRFIPLNRSVRIHIHLGYTMVGIVFLATVFFFAFFGLLCSDGDQKFCSKFTDEIMITGYVILGMLLIIGGTSYFRHYIPYEVFYGIHHLVFILYFLTVAHTLDVVQRNKARQRSQTFKWFSATLLFYFCDRAAMHLNHKYKARLVASSVVTGRKDSGKMIILRLRRPALFNFKPGQSAFLRLKDIDIHWHPFSVASSPASEFLEFYIEVYKDRSWTNKLWEILQEENEIAQEARQIEFEVMGPYGTGLAKTSDYSHALAIGSGTGIVPILSLFKQHVRQLLKLDPATYLRVLEEQQDKMIQVQRALQPRKGSLASKLSHPCSQRHQQEKASLSDSIRDVFAKHSELRRWGELRRNMKDIRKKTSEATRSIYCTVILSIMPVFGVSLLGLTISWNTVNFDLRFGMIETLEALTALFQLLFALVAIFIWDSNHIFAYVDTVLCVVSPFADWYWFLVYSENGTLSATEILLYCLLTGYMTVRLWDMTVKPRYTSWRTYAADDGFNALEKLHMVWVTRSASLVSQVLPDVDQIWRKLVSQWGEENARTVCQISVYVTEKDTVQCQLLMNELAETRLGEFIHFERPDFGSLIEDHSLDLISSRPKSTSVLAFCGSPELSAEIHHEKISNDMLLAITGSKQHQMEFVSESYGGSKPNKATTSSVQKAFDTAQTELRLNTSYSSMGYAVDYLFDSELSTNAHEPTMRLSTKTTVGTSSSGSSNSRRRFLTKRETIAFTEVPMEIEI
ncbi:oxidase homolog protein [Seminavis robusta]|uniref:Oxidase homolog protein n=1 Tax=Seminavis robusta TaxID=568900 RepID=A0A9N8HLH0_9STRA|nr:oxidase homolog protein [Seminavis robusta]|eukprot:Sro809_g205570.1 oxidase homolog protein (875) ;mRNA; f:22094-24878